VKTKYNYLNTKHSTGLLATFLTIVLFLAGCSQSSRGPGFEVRVLNTSDLSRQNVLIEIDNAELQSIAAGVNPDELVVYSAKQEVPSQLSDGKLRFIADKLKPGEQVLFSLKTAGETVKKDYPKRTQAEISVKTGGYFENRKYIGGDFENVEYLRVPDEHTDHSYYIRYEGPGWESDLVGYRFYLDWRNATDVFGKKTKEMVLQQVGLDGFDSYHEMQDWGVDVLKVGSSLGIGTLGMYFDNHAIRVDKTDSVVCSIVENGNLFSAIETDYFGWKVANDTFDIQSVLSIHAGTRLTHHEVTISGNPPNLCTGIGKDKNAKLFTDQGGSDRWGYLATYGVQSLNNDKLGLAVLFSNHLYKGITEDEYSHVVKLNPIGDRIDYYFLAVWEGEQGGLKDEESFLNYVKQTAAELARPPEVSVKGQ
jgi:hypothetical protein